MFENSAVNSKPLSWVCKTGSHALPSGLNRSGAIRSRVPSAAPLRYATSTSSRVAIEGVGASFAGGDTLEWRNILSTTRPIVFARCLPIPSTCSSLCAQVWRGCVHAQRRPVTPHDIPVAPAATPGGSVCCSARTTEYRIHSRSRFGKE